LNRTNPSIPEVHRALGEAYASRGDYQKAVEELQAVLALNAADTEAKDQLALALVQIEKKGVASHP